MDIIFSANNNEEVLTFPVVPQVEISTSQENEDFDALSGRIKIIGNMGLRTLSIESFWPVDKNYSFVKKGSEKNGWRYVEFFEKWRAKKVPMRIIIVDGDKKLLNMACLVNGFIYSVDQVGDIAYSLEIEEYVFVR